MSQFGNAFFNSLTPASVTWVSLSSNLKGMTNFRVLDLSRTQVTDAGVNELKNVLPNCDVRH